MSYVLGLDPGTTYTAAALDIDGRTEIFQLGSRTAVIPSVVVLRSDGEILTGEAAERRAQTEPGRTAREFKRRLGDPTPLILGGTPYGAESVMSLVMHAVVEQVTRQQGEAPLLTCITHPASWGPYKLELLTQAVRQAGIGESFFLTEPEAAALHYAAQERVEPGTVIGVYDFGGGTFDAAVLRKTETGFEMLGNPEGMERLGGIDFDEAVFRHVTRALDGKLEALDPNDAATQAAVTRLREECQKAKEALSADTEAVIPVILPGLHTDIRITRNEFEAMVTPRVLETVAAFERTVRSAGLEMNQLSRILLVGGTSRIPLVTALVSERTGVPTAVDAHPKHTIPLGAAGEARRRLEASRAAAAATPAPATPRAATPAAPARPREMPSLPAIRLPAMSGRTPLFAAAGVLALVVLLGFVFLGGGGDEGSQANDDTTTNGQAGVGPDVGTTPEVSQVPVTTAPAVDSSRITGITLLGSTYQVAFQTAGFTAVVPGQHVHFFFDTVPPEQAGVPGSGPWYLYGGPSPFTGYGLNDRPPGATRLCVLVANPDHSVRQGTGNCANLP